jgi:parvulin-like peptidyl-prolyl isomerase
MRRGDRFTPTQILAIVGAVIVLFLIVGVLSSFGGVDEDKDVAKVDDVGDISIPTFNHWYQVVAKQPQQGQKKPQKPPPLESKQGQALKQQVMQFLVSADWIEGEAKERGLEASPPEVQKQFQQTKKQSFPNEKAYQKFLRTTGQTVQDLYFRVRLDVLSNKIREDVTKGASDVSEGEIKDYYEKNEQQFTQPERRDLEVVLTKSQGKANQAKKAVESGQKWAKVAKDFSTDPASKNQGGKLLGVTKGQQDPAFDAAIFKAVKGQIAGPVHTGAGYYVFRVTKVTPESKQSLKASSAGIKQLLISQNQQKSLDTFATAFRSDWRANRLRAEVRDPRLPQRPGGDADDRADDAGPEEADPRLVPCGPGRARRNGRQPCNGRQVRRRHRDRSGGAEPGLQLWGPRRRPVPDRRACARRRASEGRRGADRRARRHPDHARRCAGRRCAGRRCAGRRRPVVPGPCPSASVKRSSSWMR